MEQQTGLDLNLFQHIFGNQFAIALAMCENMLFADPKNANLKRLHSALLSMRETYLNTFEGRDVG